MVKLQGTYYATPDGTVVAEGHPDARFFIGNEGDEISEKQAARWRINQRTGEPLADATPDDPELEPELEPEGEPAGDAEPDDGEKQARPAANKKREPEGDK